MRFMIIILMSLENMLAGGIRTWGTYIPIKGHSYPGSKVDGRETADVYVAYTMEFQDSMSMHGWDVEGQQSLLGTAGMRESNERSL